MTRKKYEIESIRSNVDTCDSKGIVFSRDCPQYKIKISQKKYIHVLVNHFKSQSGGGGPKRKRQAAKVRKIVKKLVAKGQYVIVLGDFNEGPSKSTGFPKNIKTLFTGSSPLVDCYKLKKFDFGGRPGTYNSCGLGNRLDYILISKNLKPKFRGGGIFRKGLWGTRKTRPDKWKTYKKITKSSEQASDHAAVFIDLDL